MRGIGVAPSVATVAVLAVLVLPSLTAGTPATGHVFRAPYIGVLPYYLNSGGGATGCAWLNNYGPVFNSTAGALPLGLGGGATRCNTAKSGSYVTGVPVEGGFYNFTFRVPTARVYNITSIWSGPIWLNATITRNHSALNATPTAQFSVTSRMWVVCLLNNSAVTGASQTVASVAYGGAGVHSTRVPLGSIDPTKAYLQPGRRYQVTEFFTFSFDASVRHAAKLGASATLSIQSSGPGILLKSVVVN